MKRNNYSTYTDRNGKVHLLDTLKLSRDDIMTCYSNRPTATDQGIIYDFFLAEKIAALLNEAEVDEAEGGAK